MASLDIKRTDDLIRRRGQEVMWYRTMRCPCVTANGYADLKCEACGALGWLREAPVPMRALVTSHSAKGQRAPAGEVQTGGRSFTPPSWVRLAEGDWIRLKEFPLRGSEVVQMGATRGDRLNELFPLEVLSAVAVRDGAMHTFPVVPTVTQDGTLVWGDGDRPRPGEKYTVMFTYHELYQVHRGDKPMQRGSEGQRISDRANLKLVTRRQLRGRD